MLRVEKVEKVEIDPLRPGRIRVEKVESTYRYSSFDPTLDPDLDQWTELDAPGASNS